MKKIISLITAAILAVASMPILSATGFSSDTAPETLSNVVVFVKFAADNTETVNTSNNFATIKGYYDGNAATSINGIDTSFKKYINTVSRGKLDINNYFPQDKNDGTTNVLTITNSTSATASDESVISEIITAFNNGTITLPGGKLDYRQSGILDTLSIIVQYDASYSDNEMFTSHRSTYPGTEKLAGLGVFNYTIVSTYTLLDSLQNQGVVTHEFMHTLGFPDLYRTSGAGSPVGIWDIMAQVGMRMQYPLSYLRSLRGWVTMGDASTAGHYTVNVASADSGDAGLIIRTPISDSEFFCVEYRKKTTYQNPGNGFDYSIPSSGLIVYRVNNSVENLTNVNPDNDYVYVFRPNDTGLHDSAGDMQSSAIDPLSGRTSYGSSDFNAAYSDNTIFYSDGTNSGIVLSNVSYSADKSQMSFDISFPDYSALGLWKKAASKQFSGFVGANGVFADGEDIFTLISSMNFDTGAQSCEALKLQNSVFADLGKIPPAFNADMCVMNGAAYYAYIDMETYSSVYVKKKTENGWEEVGSVSPANVGGVYIANDGENVYVFAICGTNGVLYKLTDGGLIMLDDTLTVGGHGFQNPDMCIFNGKIYLVNTAYGEYTKLYCFDEASEMWSEIGEFGGKSSNLHAIDSDNGKLYVLCGGGYGNTQVSFAEYDGTTLTSNSLDFASGANTGLSLCAADGIVAVSFIKETTAYVYADSGNGFGKLGGNVQSDASEIRTAITNNRVWALVTSLDSSTVTLRSKAARKPVLSAKDNSNITVLNDNSYLVLPTLTTSVEQLVTLTNGGTIGYDSSSPYFGTGRTVVLKDADGDKYKTYEVAVRFDVDGDSAVDALDIMKIEQTLSGNGELSGVYKFSADSNGNDTVDADDYSASVNNLLSLA